MKTQNNKLNFKKDSITELNDSQAIGINGGCQWSDSSGQTVSIIKISVVKTSYNYDILNQN